MTKYNVTMECKTENIYDLINELTLSSTLYFPKKFT